jgi:hypothetical protein
MRLPSPLSPWILGFALLAAVPLQAGVNRWTSIGPDGGQHWQGVLEPDRFRPLALAANPLRSGTVLAGNPQRG